MPSSAITSNATSLTALAVPTPITSTASTLVNLITPPNITIVTTANTCTTNILTSCIINPLPTGDLSLITIMNDINSYFLNCNETIILEPGSGFTGTTVGQYWTYNWPNVVQEAKSAGLNLKPVRSAIKKGLKLIMGLGFENEIKCFLGGSGVEVSHPDSDFKFVLTKDQSIISKTRHPGYSTPYKLELYTKTNVFVSKLCVYMDDTPILDHVLGILMFVKSGDEDAILRKANFPWLTKDEKIREELSQKYPFLTDKLKPRSGIFYSDVSNNLITPATPNEAAAYA